MKDTPIQNPKFYHQICKATYEDYPAKYLTKHLPNVVMHQSMTTHHGKFKLLFLEDKKTDEVIVAIRGTHNVRNWIANLTHRLSDHPILKEITKKIHEMEKKLGKKITTLVGHSAACRFTSLYDKNNKNLFRITFNGHKPRGGTRTINLYLHHDPVTSNLSHHGKKQSINVGDGGGNRISAHKIKHFDKHFADDPTWQEIAPNYFGVCKPNTYLTIPLKSEKDTRNDVIFINDVLGSFYLGKLSQEKALLALQSKYETWKKRKEHRHKTKQVSCKEWDERLRLLNAQIQQVRDSSVEQSHLNQTNHPLHQETLNQYLSHNLMLQSVVASGLQMASHYSDRFFDPNKRRVVNTLSKIHHLVPYMGAGFLQLPGALINQEQEALANTLKLNLTKQMRLIANPTKSLGKFSKNATLYYTAFSLTKFANEYPELTQKLAVSVDYLSKGVAFYKIFKYLNNKEKYLMKGKSLANFSSLAVDLAYDGIFSLIDWRLGEGNLSEDPEYYMLQDWGKVSVALFLTLPVSVIALSTCYALYCSYTKVHYERAYEAMMSNALYHLKTGHKDAASQSINKLKKHILLYHDGLSYQDQDSRVVKNAKTFLLMQDISELYHEKKYSKIINSIKFSPNMDSLTVHGCTVSIESIPQVMFHYLDALILEMNHERYQEFKLALSCIYNKFKFANGYAEKDKKEILNNLTQLESKARDRLVVLAFEKIESGKALDCKKYLSAYFTKPVISNVLNTHLASQNNLYLLGVIYMKLNDPEQSIKFFDQVKKDHRDLFFYCSYADVLNQFKLSIHDQALHQHLNILLRLCYHRAFNFINLVNDHSDGTSELSNYIEDAIDLLNKALQSESIESIERIERDHLLNKDWGQVIQSILSKQRNLDQASDQYIKKIAILINNISLDYNLDMRYRVIDYLKKIVSDSNHEVYDGSLPKEMILKNIFENFLRLDFYVQHELDLTIHDYSKDQINKIHSDLYYKFLRHPLQSHQKYHENRLVCPLKDRTLVDPVKKNKKSKREEHLSDIRLFNQSHHVKKNKKKDFLLHLNKRAY